MKKFRFSTIAVIFAVMALVLVGCNNTQTEENEDASNQEVENDVESENSDVSEDTQGDTDVEEDAETQEDTDAEEDADEESEEDADEESEEDADEESEEDADEESEEDADAEENTGSEEPVENNVDSNETVEKDEPATNSSSKNESSSSNKNESSSSNKNESSSSNKNESSSSNKNESSSSNKNESSSSNKNESSSSNKNESSSSNKNESSSSNKDESSSSNKNESSSSDEETTVNPEGEEILGEGSKDQPYLEIPGEDKSVTTVKIPAGKSLYYDIYRVGGMYFTIKSSDAYVVYNGTTYKASNGKVSFLVDNALASDAISFQIGNNGSSAQSFTITFAYPLGTYSNPEKVDKLSEDHSKSLAEGNEVGYYYNYTATKAGTIRFYITEASTDGILVVTNNRNSAQRTTEADVMTDDDGNEYIEMEVEKGDKLVINVGATPTRRGKYPAIDITWKGKYQ